MIERTCIHCGKTFLARPWKVKIGRGKFCSPNCWHKHGYSEESKKRMSENSAWKGKPAWNRGVPCPPEIRQKIAKTLTGNIISPEQRKKLSIALKGKNRGPANGNWKGGIKRTGKYSYITDENSKLVPEHRYIVEQHLGRKLMPNEVVHHINFRRDDNRIENLQVMDKVAHTAFHNSKINKQFSRSLQSTTRSIIRSSLTEK